MSPRVTPAYGRCSGLRVGRLVTLVGVVWHPVHLLFSSSRAGAQPRALHQQQLRGPSRCHSRARSTAVVAVSVECGADLFPLTHYTLSPLHFILSFWKRHTGTPKSGFAWLATDLRGSWTEPGPRGLAGRAGRHPAVCRRLERVTAGLAFSSLRFRSVGFSDASEPLGPVNSNGQTRCFE